MFLRATLAVALLASSVAAQEVNGTQIDGATAAAWCSAQINTCTVLCNGDVSPGPQDNCSTTTLDFTCLCTSNNSQPGLQYYTNTMPTFICEEVYKLCIAAGENDAAAQAQCTKTRNADCGTLDPANYTAAVSTSSSATATATSSSGTGSATASTTLASATASKAAAASLMIGSEYGTGLLAAGVAAIFGFLL
jgi:hypothetical protein